MATVRKLPLYFFVLIDHKDPRGDCTHIQAIARSWKYGCYLCVAVDLAKKGRLPMADLKNPVVFCIPEATVAVTHRIDLYCDEGCDGFCSKIISIDTILGMYKYRALCVALNFLYQISR